MMTTQDAAPVLYVHHIITREYDYDTYEGTSHRLAYSHDNAECISDMFGFEHVEDFDASVAMKRELVARVAPTMTLVVGRTIRRRYTFNQHGLI